MQHYLTFALVAPMASFGAIAIGERRTGWDRPARSAVLGLAGACLGVEREDDEGQAALASDYGLAIGCHEAGRLLADYHTAQVPSTQRSRRFRTRAEELAAPELNTILTRRDYRTDAWHTAALWPTVAAPRWTLEEIAKAMRAPRFLPYLGRKSCPLGLPLAPAMAEAPDAAAALAWREREGPEAEFRHAILNRRDAAPPTVLVVTTDIGEVSNDDARCERIEFRRDRTRSARRRQFDLRDELVLKQALS